MLPESERITMRNASGAVKVKDKYIDESILCFKEWFCPQTESYCQPNYCNFATVLDRLASYEDTQLTPEEIKLMRLERDALIARKPAT